MLTLWLFFLFPLMLLFPFYIFLFFILRALRRERISQRRFRRNAFSAFSAPSIRLSLVFPDAHTIIIILYVCCAKLERTTDTRDVFIKLISLCLRQRSTLLFLFYTPFALYLPPFLIACIFSRPTLNSFDLRTYRRLHICLVIP